MGQTENPVRYSIITDKNPREIVMLRGSGCRYLRCRFCDYHLDSSRNEEENYRINKGRSRCAAGLGRGLRRR